MIIGLPLTSVSHKNPSKLDKMAAVSEDISDRELREKLKEYGISAGPITPTTKSLYIRKLNKHLIGVGRGLNSNARKPASKKSLSPRKSPSRRRSPVRDARSSVGGASPSNRKLVGFSSDEEEVAQETVALKRRHLSGRVRPAPTPTNALCSDEERPLLRFDKRVNMPTDKLNVEEEKLNIDGRATVSKNHDELNQNAAKRSPYTGLRQLFMRKSMDNRKKSSPPAERVQPKVSCAVEYEDKTRRNVYRYLWLLVLLGAVMFVAFKWEFVLALVWKGEDSRSTCKNTLLHLLISIFVNFICTFQFLCNMFF